MVSSEFQSQMFQIFNVKKLPHLKVFLSFLLFQGIKLS